MYFTIIQRTCIARQQQYQQYYSTSYSEGILSVNTVFYFFHFTHLSIDGNSFLLTAILTVFLTKISSSFCILDSINMALVNLVDEVIKGNKAMRGVIKVILYNDCYGFLGLLDIIWFISVFYCL